MIAVVWFLLFSWVLCFNMYFDQWSLNWFLCYWFVFIVNKQEIINCNYIYYGSFEECHIFWDDSNRPRSVIDIFGILLDSLNRTRKGEISRILGILWRYFWMRGSLWYSFKLVVSLFLFSCLPLFRYAF